MTRRSIPFLSRAILMTCACLAACAGPLRTTSDPSLTGARAVYAFSRAEADRVLLHAMLKTFPDNAIERANVPAPVVRYQARISFALDSHVIIGTAVPTALKDGREGEGYVFEVSDFGSMPITGSSRAERLFSEIRAQIADRKP